MKKHIQNTVQVAKDQTHRILRGTRAGPHVCFQFSEFRIREIVISGIVELIPVEERYFVCADFDGNNSLRIRFQDAALWLIGVGFVQDSRLMVPTALQFWA